MKPVLQSHEAYQQSILDRLPHYYDGSRLVLRNKQWPLIAKCWVTNLSPITTLVIDQYASKGPEPRDPACMLRSYLLSLMTTPEIGITGWIEKMHEIPLYAILSGFDPQDIPGIGTFYDFFRRLWAAEKKNIKPKKHKRKKKCKKGKKKGDKAPTTTPGKVRRLIGWLTRETAKKADLPTDKLFEFFETQILSVSAELGLLGDMDKLNTAGDGTPLVTAAMTRSKSACECYAQGLADCNHPRIYSQPDCNSGWDSSREKYFYGYHLYMLSASASKYDLPLYPKLQPASRHDSISLVISSVEFQQRFTLGKIDKMLLDAAHDAQAIYEMLDAQGIEPFIDLNPRKNNTETKTDILISPHGIPICPKGLEMKPNGYDNKHDRQKWRCPLVCGTTNSCTTPCSQAKYGRTYHTYPKCDLRLFPKTLRGSMEWKLIYKRRTSVERSNKREKVDYKLESGRHRSTMMWYMRVYGIMMCQHIDAWYAVKNKSLGDLKATLYSAVAAA